MKAILAATCLTMLATVATAHITLETTKVPVGSTYKAVLRVPHGCAGEATTTVRVQIPEGVISVKPMPKPGWNLETVTGPYAKSYEYFSTALTEGVREVVWSGGELPDAFYDEFVFRGTLAGDWQPDSAVYFPVVQECGTSAERWIEIPAEGQRGDDLEYPAPGIVLTPAVAGH